MKKGRAKGLRFHRLHVENWRNFTRVDVALAPRVFLVGPNASGKSNLLDVFRFFQDLVRVGGGFVEAVRRRGGVGKIRSLAARQSPDVVVAAELSLDDRVIWQYELQFSEDSHRSPIIRKERVLRDGVELWARPNDDDRSDPERLTQTFLEQINVNKDFREVAEFFRSIRYLHLVPQLVREPDRSAGKTNDPYGGDFLEQVAAKPQNVREARLKQILRVLKVAVPQLQDLQFYRDDVRGTPHLRGKYKHWRPHGAWQSEDQFSDGTLRLLALLWSMLEESGPLLLEEPELSLHPDIVAHIPQMFAAMQIGSGRQVMVSTHAPSMLQDEGIGLDEVLLLIPNAEGTAVRPANSVSQILELMEGGIALSDAVLPYTRPADAQQLSLFQFPLRT
jgi:predicted ATPase